MSGSWPHRTADRDVSAEARPARLSIFTDLTTPQIAREAGYTHEDLEPVFTVMQTDFYIVMSKDTPAAVATAWQTTLDEMKKDGSFETIYRRYVPDADLGDLLKR